MFCVHKTNYSLVVKATRSVKNWISSVLLKWLNLSGRIFAATPSMCVVTHQGGRISDLSPSGCVKRPLIFNCSLSLPIESDYFLEESMFHSCQDHLFLRRCFIYFSDGAASQYKNCKNFISLCADFGIKAECHFSATSHGKSAYDGLGGTVKRLAARASLHRPYEQQIMTPFQVGQGEHSRHSFLLL